MDSRLTRVAFAAALSVPVSPIVLLLAFGRRPDQIGVSNVIGLVVGLLLVFGAAFVLLSFLNDMTAMGTPATKQQIDRANAYAGYRVQAYQGLARVPRGYRQLLDDYHKKYGGKSPEDPS